LQPRRIATLAREACEEKKGQDVVILDLKRLAAVASYFVITSGTSSRHVRAIADNVAGKLAEKRVVNHHIEGGEDALWILLDYGGVLIHVFHHDTRRFYNLERLWGGARRI
jgi:ribosome-associated protein